MDQLNKALTAVAGVLGLVYIVGMGAVALRLTLNHLPRESVLTQLTQPYLVVIGLEVVLPVALAAAVCTAVIWLFSGEPFDAASSNLELDRAHQVDTARALKALGTTGFLLAMLVVAYEFLVVPPISANLMLPAWIMQWVGPAALLVAVVFIGSMLALGAKPDRRPYRRTITLTAIGIVAAAGLVVWGGISGTSPPNYVKVCPKPAAGKASSTEGTLVASSGGEVLIARYPTGARRGSAGVLETVAGDEIAAMYVGANKSDTYGRTQCPAG